MKPNLAFSDCAALQAGDALDSRRERGFTLIEVLVTVFILCLGLLGVGSLQYLSIKSNQSALTRAVATEYAYQVLDYIRSYPGITMTPSASSGALASTKCGTDNYCQPQQFEFQGETSPDDGMKDLFTQLQEDLGEETKMLVCRSKSADLSSLPTTLINSTTNCSAYSSFDGDSEHKYYVVTIQAPDRASANSEPIRIVVVGEVL